jgi:hypothetical protein
LSRQKANQLLMRVKLTGATAAGERLEFERDLDR